MVSLFYHLESDYDINFFVYVINQLTEVTQKVCPIEFGDAKKIYHKIAREDAKFARKGLEAPRWFRTSRGGYNLHNSIFLLHNGEVEYYWRGNLDTVFEKILQGGQAYLNSLCLAP